MVVIIMSCHVLLHQFVDCLLQGSPPRRLLFAGVLLLGLLLITKVLIGTVQLVFRQWLVSAHAKAVYCVDAGVIYRPDERRLFNLMKGYVVRSRIGVHKILAVEIFADFIPTEIKLTIVVHISMRACIDMAIAALRIKKLI